MKISVVIPAYNEEHYIKACLDGLQKQVKKPYEIIVVDNNSTDKTAEIVKNYKNVKLLKQKIKGTIATRNLGFDSAKGDIIARCDADTVVSPDWVKNIANDFKKSNSIVGVSNLIVMSGILERFKFLFYIYMFVPRRFLGYHSLVGPSMAIRKDAWNKIRKELCTDNKAVHEDVDVAFHIKKLGDIYFDKDNVAITSSRRVKHNPWSFFVEYPIRFFRMLGSH